MILFGFILCVLGIIKLIIIHKTHKNEIEDMALEYTSNIDGIYQLVIGFVLSDALISILCGSYILYLQ